MYGWGDDPSTWYGEKKDYDFDERSKARRERAASRSAAAGPRTYKRKGAPDTQRTDPTKRIRAAGRTPMIIAVDVTGSMARWPVEIFDRLPLLFNTLSQYKEDLELSFIAIGDERADRWPLQVTNFATGFDLEEQLTAVHGEGGGGDIPESYGLLAWYVDNRVDFEADHKPFLIVFGDATMHEQITAKAITEICGVEVGQDIDAIATWRRVASKWNTWFLRRPTGRPGDATHQQWVDALGEDHVVQIEDEQRAVDCAMGIVSRAWGRFDDFRGNMLARQDGATVTRIEDWVKAHGPRVLECPKCGAPIPPSADGRFTCGYCSATLMI